MRVEYKPKMFCRPSITRGGCFLSRKWAPCTSLHCAKCRFKSPTRHSVVASRGAASPRARWVYTKNVLTTFNTPCGMLLMPADIRDVVMRAGLDAAEPEVVLACACGKGFLPTLVLSLSLAAPPSHISSNRALCRSPCFLSRPIIQAPATQRPVLLGFLACCARHHSVILISENISWSFSFCRQEMVYEHRK
jgi:hypothetical protein